jgi:hypothetical protein
MDRRQALKFGAVATGAAWVAPQIISVSAASAQSICPSTHIYDVKATVGDKLTLNGTTVSYSQGGVGAGIVGGQTGTPDGTDPRLTKLQTSNYRSIDDNTTLTDYVFLHLQFSPPAQPGALFWAGQMDGLAGNDQQLGAIIGFLGATPVVPTYQDIGSFVFQDTIPVANQLPGFTLPSPLDVVRADGLHNVVPSTDQRAWWNADFGTNFVSDVFFIFAISPTIPGTTNAVKRIVAIDAGIEHVLCVGPPPGGQGPF